MMCPVLERALTTIDGFACVLCNRHPGGLLLQGMDDGARSLLSCWRLWCQVPMLDEVLNLFSIQQLSSGDHFRLSMPGAVSSPTVPHVCLPAVKCSQPSHRVLVLYSLYGCATMQTAPSLHGYILTMYGWMLVCTGPTTTCGHETFFFVEFAVSIRLVVGLQRCAARKGALQRGHTPRCFASTLTESQMPKQHCTELYMPEVWPCAATLQSIALLLHPNTRATKALDTLTNLTTLDNQTLLSRVPKMPQAHCRNRCMRHMPVGLYMLTLLCGAHQRARVWQAQE